MSKKKTSDDLEAWKERIIIGKILLENIFWKRHKWYKLETYKKFSRELELIGFRVTEIRYALMRKSHSRSREFNRESIKISAARKLIKIRRMERY